MTDTINEQLSAFMDGELPPAERELLWRRLGDDPALRAAWRRYHLIRDAWRGDLPEFIPTDAAAPFRDTRVAQPAPRRPAAPKSTLQSTMQSTMRRAGPRMAIAASVAALALGGVVGGVLYSDSRFGPVPRQTAAYITAIPQNCWQSVAPAVVASLNGYLVDHSHYAGIGAAQGIMPYSRVAGYDNPDSCLPW